LLQRGTILFAFVSALLILFVFPQAAQASDEGEWELLQFQQETGVDEPEIDPLYENVEEATPEGEEGIYVMESTVVIDTQIYELPLLESTVLGQLQTGENVSVFKTEVADCWNAIVLQDGEIRYVHMDTIELTAGKYAYSFGADMTRITNFTAAELEKALAGTELSGLGDVYSQIEKEYGINALFLISIAKLESAGGSSSLAQRQNNLGGLKNGGSGYMSFDTKADCIRYMAQLLKENYLTEGAKYFFGKTVSAVNTRYCEGSSWSVQVEDIMRTGYEMIIA
jgi:beta-N-acetylglucosaminidase